MYIKFCNIKFVCMGTKTKKDYNTVSNVYRTPNLQSSLYMTPISSSSSTQLPPSQLSSSRLPNTQSCLPLSLLSPCSSTSLPLSLISPKSSSPKSSSQSLSKTTNIPKGVGIKIIHNSNMFDDDDDDDDDDDNNNNSSNNDVNNYYLVWDTSNMQFYYRYCNSWFRSPPTCTHYCSKVIKCRYGQKSLKFCMQTSFYLLPDNMADVEYCNGKLIVANVKDTTILLSFAIYDGNQGILEQKRYFLTPETKPRCCHPCYCYSYPIPYMCPIPPPTPPIQCCSKAYIDANYNNLLWTVSLSVGFNVQTQTLSFQHGGDYKIELFVSYPNNTSQPRSVTVLLSANYLISLDYHHTQTSVDLSNILHGNYALTGWQNTAKLFSAKAGDIVTIQYFENDMLINQLPEVGIHVIINQVS